MHHDPLAIGKSRFLISALTFAILAYGAVIPATSFAEVRDGRLFDPGVTFSEPAEGAPEALAKMAGFVGDWDVELEIQQSAEKILRSEGIAKVTFMNRGHAILERTRFADFDGAGHPMSTLAFLAVDGNGVWTASEGNSWTESISLASGGFEGESLVLYDAMRPSGGPNLLLLRHTYAPTGGGETDGLSPDGFEMTLESSTDRGATWTPRVTRSYRRREPSRDFFPTRPDIGLPASDRAAEAGEFDFLLGEFDASHWLQSPRGVRQWRSNATAVHALDGHAILEFDWHDMDPSLPDSATSILRVYNRSMRRWESLFLPNRFNRALHFGGVRENDRIVLHPFDVQTGGGTLSQWIFFSPERDSYRWKGLGSSDRGATQSLSWGIEFQRKGTAPEDRPRPLEVSTTTGDGSRIFGDHYRPSRPAAKTIVLFHQARGDARGEYASIARRLFDEGFEVFAWDARGGGDQFGQPNRTVAAGDAAIDAYCAAYPDLEAGLEHAYLYGSGGPLFAFGSSYSAALVVRLAAEHGGRLAGAAAFSPASGRMGECAVETWLPKVDGTPLLAFRPESETAIESVVGQSRLLTDHGVELFVAPGGVHGASMLDPERAEGDVEPTWLRLLEFLADPNGSEPEAGR